MKITRRKFLRNSILTSIGLMFFPDLITKISAKSKNEILNFIPDPSLWKNENITLSWLGHSTVLLNFYGTWILTDPALLERVGLHFFGTSIGPSRLTPPALFIEELPKPDIVLLSHAHMDHMDYPTLKKITEKYPNEIDVVTAYLTADVISDLAWKSITVLDWTESASFMDLKITALEVEHFGWRYPWEKDRSRGYHKDGRSYNAYLIEKKGKSILFGGDTRMTEKFSVLKDKKTDIAIMPVGAYNPWRRSHCNPAEALKMADNINADYFIPIHCKTFRQSNEPFNEPIEWLNKEVVNYNIKLGLNEIGQTFTLSKDS